MKNFIVVAAAQINSFLLEPNKNFEKALNFIKSAVKKKAELIVLPELFDVGYDLEAIRNFHYNTSHMLGLLSKAAEEHDIYVVAGILEQVEDKKYNTMFVFDKNGILVTKYRKISLFGNEKTVFDRGNRLETFDIEGIRFGLINCYDVRFPEISRGLIDKKCSVLLISSAFPSVRGMHLDILLRARAIENQVYVVSSNRVGENSGISFSGNSCIIDPLGNAQSLDSSLQDCLIGTIEMDMLKSVRANMTCLDDKEILGSILT